MAATDPAARAIAVLTEKEMEVLLLLTAGHTIKSIAASLGRSEASINERLRDARRKTGIGSSRELARLVAGQENWPRKTDLTETGNPPLADGKPASAEPHRSKGRIAMSALLPLAAGLLLVSSNSVQQVQTPSPAQSERAGPSPLVGKWSLDTARIPADERPRSVTIAFAVSAARQWTTRVEIVGGDGARQYADSTAATDGVPVPVSGNMTLIDSVSLRQPATNTLVMTLGKGGSPIATRVYTVARDGKTMTETIIWAGQAMPRMETTHFTRVG